MSRTLRRQLAFIALATGLSGCFTLDYAEVPRTSDGHVLVSNYGWRLFNCLPLVCGNATDPSAPDYGGPWAFFRDDVTMDKVQSRFMRHAKSCGKEPSDLICHNYDTIFITIPFTGIPIPIPYVVCYREIQLSGILK